MNDTTDVENNEKPDKQSELMHVHGKYQDMHPITDEHLHAGADIQELISQFRKVVDSHFYNPDQFIIKLVPKIKYSVINHSRVDHFRKKIKEMIDRLESLGHGDVAFDLEHISRDMSSDFYMYQNGTKIEIAVEGYDKDIVARTELDTVVLAEIGYHFDFATGIVEGE